MVTALLRPTRAAAPPALALLLVAAAAAGCADDPRYLVGPTGLEAGGPAAAGQPPPGGAARMTLPLRRETDAERADRDALAGRLGVEVPYVRVGDLAVSVDWTIKNLDGVPGTATLFLDGGNELHAYDPTVLDLAPGDEEAPPPPSLAGGVPLAVPAGAVVSGELREDQLLEASIDLDLITRGNLNPFAASLRHDRDRAEFQPLTPPRPGDPDYVPTPDGPAVPRAAFAQQVILALRFDATAHMVLEYVVRVRDHRGLLHPRLLDAPADELAAFDPPVYAPQPPAVP